MAAVLSLLKIFFQLGLPDYYFLLFGIFFIFYLNFIYTIRQSHNHVVSKFLLKSTVDLCDEF